MCLGGGDYETAGPSELKALSQNMTCIHDSPKVKFVPLRLRARMLFYSFYLFFFIFFKVERQKLIKASARLPLFNTSSLHFTVAPRGSAPDLNSSGDPADAATWGFLYTWKLEQQSHFSTSAYRGGASHLQYQSYTVAQSVQFRVICWSLDHFGQSNYPACFNK